MQSTGDGVLCGSSLEAPSTLVGLTGFVWLQYSARVPRNAHARCQADVSQDRTPRVACTYGLRRLGIPDEGRSAPSPGRVPVIAGRAHARRDRLLTVVRVVLGSGAEVRGSVIGRCHILDIGTTEIAVILILVLVLFGPDRIPQVLRSFGKVMRELRKTLSDVQTEIEDAAKKDRERES